MARTTSRFASKMIPSFALVLAVALAIGCGDDDAEPGGGAGTGAGGGAAGTSGGGSGAGSGAGNGGDGGGGSGSGGNAGGAPLDGGSEQDGGEDDGGSDPGGGGMDALWNGCPERDDYPGHDNGPHTLVATDGAVYCATFDESRTLQEELAAKAMLRVAPGTYGLPGADANSFGLPLCIRFASPPHPEMERAGATTYTELQGGSNTTHAYFYRQRFALGSGMRTLDTRLEIVTAGDEPASITLDGEDVPAFADADRISFTLCEDPDNCFPSQVFESCTFPNAPAQRHTVELGDDGSVELELHIGESFAGTEPGAFVRATGTFRGVAFDQRDYFKLIYSPDHHHFVRDFAVLFDEPIGDACGIEISRLEPFPDGTEPDEAHAIACDLERIEALTVTDHVFEGG